MASDLLFAAGLEGGGHCLSMVDLVVKDSSFLVNLNHWSASVVVDDSSNLVLGESVSFSEFLVTRVLLRHGSFVTNSDRRINKAIIHRSMRVSVWVEDTGEFVVVELTSLGLMVSILDTVFLAIDGESSVTFRNCIDTSLIHSLTFL